MKKNIATYLLWSAALILVFTGLLKLISALGESRLLARPDPLFSFATNRQVLFLASMMEFGVALLLICHANIPLRASALAWLSTNFLAYRVALWEIGYQGECRCLGDLTQWLSIKQGTRELITIILIAYLLIVAYSLLTRHCLAHKTTSV